MMSTAIHSFGTVAEILTLHNVFINFILYNCVRTRTKLHTTFQTPFKTNKQLFFFLNIDLLYQHKSSYFLETTIHGTSKSSEKIVCAARGTNKHFFFFFDENVAFMSDWHTRSAQHIFVRQI